MGHVFLLLGFTILKTKLGAAVRYNKKAPWSSRKHPSDLKVLTTGIQILTFYNRKMEKVMIKIKLQQ